ncbi:CinA family protein [Mucilaginibacter sp.]|jgi:nicotinamide-nucleotide amidase|uniref:CinA family protein n=1 Tax=Mucilaginibacter sp. TaxID=1882438 RepID=UPI0035616FE2
MPSAIVKACTKLLLDQELTIAFAESASGGRLSSEFSLIPDCGKILKGGIVCYDACIKQDVLGVPEELVEKYTPESAEVTKELAERLQQLMKADIQVAVTGLTMPGGSETPEKPVGTMFIHAIIKNDPVAVKEVYKGNPEQIVLQTVDKVAQLIINKLKK